MILSINGGVVVYHTRYIEQIINRTECMLTRNKNTFHKHLIRMHYSNTVSTST